MEFERRLSQCVQQRHGGGAHRAIRQIELERQRLGRELHTGVGQLLAAIRLHLEVIAVELPNPSSKVGQALDNISTLAADTLEQVRRISRRLHPPEWQRLTLESAVRQFWDLSGIPQRFEADLAIDADLYDPDLDVKVLMYRGLQEALSNIVRHSKATRLSVELGYRERMLVMSVATTASVLIPVSCSRPRQCRFRHWLARLTGNRTGIRRKAGRRKWTKWH